MRWFRIGSFDVQDRAVFLLGQMFQSSPAVQTCSAQTLFSEESKDGI